MKNNKDYKTLQFYRFALSIGAIDNMNEKIIDISKLLTQSFLFLMQDKVLTHNQTQEYYIFKDRYNRYLAYCEEKGLVNKGEYQQIVELNIISVPDMSHIKVPDIKDELKNRGIELDTLINLFSKLGQKKG